MAKQVFGNPAFCPLALLFHTHNPNPLAKLAGDIRMGDELFKETCDQDITDFRRHQVEAYTNLEDLLDEPWEESDFAPPSKVDVVLRVGGEIGERYNNV